MTRLDFPVYLDHIHTETTRLRDVLAPLDPAARVPSCPDWTAADLLWHLGGQVQHFWAHVIRHRPADPGSYVEPTRPASYDGLLAFLDETSAGLLDLLATADPAEPAWSWASDRTVGFTLRRQAHEALIHRLDAELTAGTTTPLDPALAADGVQEVLDVFYGGKPEWLSFAPLPHHVRVDATDTDTQVWVQLGTASGSRPGGEPLVAEPDLAVVADPGTEPDAVVEGLAADLDAWLWRRGDDAGIHVAGDLDVYARFRALVDQPITDD